LSASVSLYIKDWFNIVGFIIAIKHWRSSPAKRKVIINSSFMTEREQKRKNKTSRIDSQNDRDITRISKGI